MAQVVAVLAVLWSVFIVAVTLDQPIAVWLQLWAAGLWLVLMGGWAVSVAVRIGRRRHAAVDQVLARGSRVDGPDDGRAGRHGAAVLPLSSEERRRELKRRLEAAQGVRGPARIVPRRGVSGGGPEAA